MRTALGALSLGLMLTACDAPAEPISDQTEGPIAESDAESASETGTPQEQTGVALPEKTVACSGAERIVFSCRTSNGKRIAVCAAPDGKVEYRYGRGKPDLTLLATQYASTPYSGGGEIQIGFANDATRYIVFSRMVRTNFEPGELNDPAMSDGVIVQRGEDVLNLQLCDDPAVKSIDYDLVEALVPEADELLTYETQRADRSGEGGL